MFKKLVLIVCLLNAAIFVSHAKSTPLSFHKTLKAPLPVSPATATVTAASGGIISIDCLRKAPNNAKFPLDFPVEITIKKNNLFGYAKIIETLPVGFTATVIEAQGAKFSFVGQKVTFVWETLPAQNELKISYMVSIAPNTKGIQITEGVFYFIENDRTLKFVLPQTSVSIIDPVIEQVIASTKKSASPVIETKPAAKLNSQTSKPKEEKKKEKINASYSVAPTGNITFRVQFMALYEINVKEPPVFENITEPITTFLSQGFIQYTVGPFYSFEEALKKKEEMELLGYTGSFMKAFKDKRRITIKEARSILETKFSLK